jgi:hypothetical protein
MREKGSNKVDNKEIRFRINRTEKHRPTLTIRLSFRWLSKRVGGLMMGMVAKVVGASPLQPIPSHFIFLL